VSNEITRMNEWKIVCSECKAEDSIRSDERVYSTYRVNACSADDIDYDSASENTYDSCVDGYFCEECQENFSHDEVVKMIRKVSE
jgi:protein-arginine kinase activator protein McsA